MAFQKHSRWSRRLLAALPGWGLAGALGVSAVAVCGLANSARGQEAAPEGGVNRTFVNKPLVHLPIEIEGNYRSQISSLVLYAKDGATGAWSIRDKAAPMQTAFTFRAPRDGEYWFRIVAVDNQGKSHPDDLAKDPQDAVVVVVDATPPALDMAYLGNSPEGHVVQCTMRDANPDVLKTRFFYQTRDQVWRHLESAPNQPNVFCIPSQAALTNFIRVLAVDLAGNTTAKTLNLSELVVAPAAATTAAQPNPATVYPAAPAMAQAPTTLPTAAAQQSQTTYVPPPTNVTTVAAVNQMPAPQPLMPAIIEAPMHADYRTPAQPMPSSVRINQTPPVANQGPTLEMPPAQRLIEPAVLPPIQTTSGTLSHQAAPVNLQLVGSPQVFLNYAVENIGASGVGRMEIYASRDRGQSWTKIAEELSRKNPAEVTLPGEGLFGLKLVASNGRGFGAQAPQSGDPADWWIEVDTTKPKASITGVRPGTGQEAGVMHVFWQAEDKNLAAESIELYHAPSREGPWAPIAKNLKNTGQHRWTPPTDAGAHAFIRLLVRDKAGNLTLSETTESVLLDDQSRPRIRLLGVTESHPSGIRSDAPGAILPVQTTNTPVGTLRPAHHTTSSVGVEIR